MIDLNPKKIKNIIQLEEIIVEEGIFKVSSFLDTNELTALKKEVAVYHKTNGNHYPFGTTYSINNITGLPYSSFQKKVFSKPWMKELFLALNHNVSKGYFDSIYSTHDFKFDEGVGRNGYLHFDRNRSLKFFFYLNDVNEENGAFFIQPNSHKLGRKLRERAWGRLIPCPKDNLIKKILLKLFGKQFSNIKNRIEIDYPELYDSNKLIPVVGKAGTLIVFDSDIFHQGGKINQKGLERIILRMHNYLS